MIAKRKHARTGNKGFAQFTFVVRIISLYFEFARCTTKANCASPQTLAVILNIVNKLKLYNTMNENIERICEAAFEGRIDELKTYLNSNVDINASGRNWTILGSAIENQNIKCVSLIIEKGANVEFKGEDGLTPLEHAIDISIQSNNNTGGKEGDESIEIIKLLLEAGADPKSGLRIASSYGSTKIATLLMNYIAEDK